MQEGKIYLISNYKVQEANSQYNRLKNKYEVIIFDDAKVKPCHHDANIPSTRFHFCPISQVKNKQQYDKIGTVTLNNYYSLLYRILPLIYTIAYEFIYCNIANISFMIATDVLGVVVKSNDVNQIRDESVKTIDIVDDSQPGGAKVGNYLKLHRLSFTKTLFLNCQLCIIVSLFTR